jgi:hypothetical protein
VVGYIAAAIDPVDAHTAPGPLVFIPEQVLSVPAAAKREGMGMFQQKQRGWPGPCGDLSRQIVLQMPGLFVLNHPQTVDDKF